LVNEVNAVVREGDYACPESSLMAHHTSTMRMILILNDNCNSSNTDIQTSAITPFSGDVIPTMLMMLWWLIGVIKR
jgi:hypothetical protein